MIRLHVVVLALSLSGLAACADEPAARAPDAKGTILVRFHDGGMMRLKFGGEHLQVTTKHGQLKIAVADIRKLELATRIPPSARAEIEEAIRGLGDAQFKVREAAMLTLKKHREKAYPALLQAARDTDMEVQNRAKELLTWLEEAVPPEKLQFRAHDTIHTNDSTIAGRIEAGSLQVDSVQFGKLELKLADAASIDFVGNGSVATLKLDGRYAIQQEVWLDTNLDFFAGTSLAVEAEGEIDMYATGGYTGQYVGTPSGKKVWPGKTGLPYEPGTLIGKIGKSGVPFVIGAKYQGAVKVEGRLYLRAAGNPYSVQTAGEYKIRVVGGLAAR